MKSNRIKAIEKIHMADKLLREAIQLLPKNQRFVRYVVDSQLLLDDAIIFADPKQTIF